ncbi:hypothetical protein GM658_11805 [Pseudoduganella eburnea]|uniref:Big-1 domain-containing protein n=1 Tax=Massilia eburnea TaxID=1776165 RepID=A0A6L6QFL0_9BURK|nr:Ig-like domain-containing protein [Massilia eburnea]MTW11278.1 hypothetical protein [Massilia eburnea]
MLMQTRMKSFINFLAACLLAGFLAACGGGGTNDGCINIDPSRSSSLPSCSGSGGTTTPGTGTSTSGTLTLAMQDSSGAALTNLTPDVPATVNVVVKNANGVAVSNNVVTFTTSDTTGVFSPAIGTALTDGNGMASLKLAAGTQAGAFTLTASSVIGSSTVKATKSYTVSFPVLTTSDIIVSPSTVPAGANASVTLSIKNGSTNYTSPVSVAFTSICTKSGKALIGSPVITQNGVAVASYTDKGCGTTDTLTATAVVPNATLTKSVDIVVLPAAAGSLKFVGVDTTNIALKFTGGVGRPEFSTVKFQVFDMNGAPVVGKLVSFVFSDSNQATTTGGLKLNPATATTAADGTVTTTVSDGTIPTSVRVVASVVGSSPLLTTISSLLVVSSGVPDQRHFTVLPEVGNAECWNIIGKCVMVSAYLADHFGNQVTDGTVVNFTTEGGMIIDSCQTVNGLCSVPLYSSFPHPLDGRVTILAYALGEENFLDKNNNNTFNDGIDGFNVPGDDLSPDIFRDDNEDGLLSAGEPCIGPNTNGTCTTPGDLKYNGVLRIPQQPSPQAQYISTSFVMQFSSSHAQITVTPSPISCTGTSTDVQVTVKDDRNLLMPAGTKIAFSATYGATAVQVSPSEATVPSVILPVGGVIFHPTYVVTIPCSGTATGTFNVTVTTPGGTVTPSSTRIN